MTSRQKSKGFTLVELLVVMAIIGILVGMLLPAVQSVREAARRTSCLNNLRQMALASINYQSAHQRFPAASDGGWIDDGGQYWGFSLHTYLLPYLEQNALSDQFLMVRGGNSTSPWQFETLNPANITYTQVGGDPREFLSSQQIDLFVCPSATQKDELANVDVENGVQNGTPDWGGREYTTHYLGVTGSGLGGGLANGIARDGIFSGDIKAVDADSLYNSNKVGKTPSDIRD